MYVLVHHLWLLLLLTISPITRLWIIKVFLIIIHTGSHRQPVSSYRIRRNYCPVWIVYKYKTGGRSNIAHFVCDWAKNVSSYYFYSLLEILRLLSISVSRVSLSMGDLLLKLCTSLMTRHLFTNISKSIHFNLISMSKKILWTVWVFISYNLVHIHSPRHSFVFVPVSTFTSISLQEHKKYKWIT